MQYEVQLKSRAIKDLRHIQENDASRIFDAIEKLENNLTGDIKRLTNFTTEYRLRVGDYRVLFEIEDKNRIVIYRVRHRREAYRN